MSCGARAGLAELGKVKVSADKLWGAQTHTRSKLRQLFAQLVHCEARRLQRQRDSNGDNPPLSAGKTRPIEFCRRVPLWLASVGECGTIDLFWEEQQTTWTLVSEGLHLSKTALIALAPLWSNLRPYAGKP